MARVWIFIFIFLLFGCGKKDKASSETNSTSKKEKIIKKELSKATITEPKYPKFFYIKDVDNRKSRIDIYKDRVLFHKIKQKIVVLNIFSATSPPCRGFLPYLNDLQKRNKKDIFVLGILIDKDMDSISLRKFMKRYHLSFFISNYYTNSDLVNSLLSRLKLPTIYKIPLTIIYKNGKYVIHLSGAVPPEMIKNIIDQLK